MTSSRDDDESTASVVRHDERARVSLPVRVRSRVRLVKEVVTEEVTQTFTLRREVLRVEEEPGGGQGAELDWSSQLTDWPALDLEIVLHAEQLVFSTVVVPIERVHVRTQIVASDVPVSTDLRRERVDVERVDVEQSTAGHHEQTGASAGGAPTTKERKA